MNEGDAISTNETKADPNVMTSDIAANLVSSLFINAISVLVIRRMNPTNTSEAVIATVDKPMALRDERVVAAASSRFEIGSV